MFLIKAYNLKCPSCKNENTLRSSRARNVKEKILKAISFCEVYKCKKCGWRGWKIIISFKQKVIRKLFLYLLLMILAALIVYRILKIIV
jgi:predicted RNA-binding Zn-ribbon protein involved in translation (DUF1610 family)